MVAHSGKHSLKGTHLSSASWWNWCHKLELQRPTRHTQPKVQSLHSRLNSGQQLCTAIHFWNQLQKGRSSEALLSRQKNDTQLTSQNRAHPLVKRVSWAVRVTRTKSLLSTLESSSASLKVTFLLPTSWGYCEGPSAALDPQDGLLSFLPPSEVVLLTSRWDPQSSANRESSCWCHVLGQNQCKPGAEGWVPTLRITLHLPVNVTIGVRAHDVHSLARVVGGYTGRCSFPGDNRTLSPETVTQPVLPPRNSFRNLS